jgi:predicted TIM-barrel fold metal-dependent hydrolase
MLVLDGRPLIDVHLHPARRTGLKLDWATWMQGFAPPPGLYDGAGDVVPAAFDAYLAEEGVDAAVALCEYSPRVTGWQTAEDMAALTVANPRRVYFAANVNPHVHYPVADELQRQLALGAVALKIHPVHAGFPADDQAMYPAYEICQAAGIPLVVHFGTSTFPGALNRFADPALRDRVLSDFRSLNVVLAHGGRGWWYDAAAFLALADPRVWIELSGLPPSRLRTYYAKHNWTRLTRRMIFATDWPGIPGIAANARAVAALCPDEETAALVLGGNAMQVYPLEPALPFSGRNSG